MKRGLLLLVCLAWALACGVEKAEFVDFIPLQKITFDVLDGVDDSFEGEDLVRIKAIEGEIASAELFVSGNGFSSVHQMREKNGDGVYQVRVDFDAYPVEWYINVRGSGNSASAGFGSLNEPNVAQKYLNKANADLMMMRRFKEGLSDGSVFRDYEPNAFGETFSYPPEGSGLSDEVIAKFDHYVFTFYSEDYHQAYGVEYSTEVTSSANGIIPVTGEALSTEASRSLEGMPSHNIGYIIVPTTTRDGLGAILNDPNFFPITLQRPFIEIFRK